MRSETAGTLAKAIRIAATAHEGQKDKAGEAYVLHPLRVMSRVRSEEEKIVAVLHDLLEDTGWTREGLRQHGFSEAVLNALDALTRRHGEEYADFVRRAGRDPIAHKVKEADLLDNMDVTRLRELGPEDQARLAKYHAALILVRSISGAQA